VKAIRSLNISEISNIEAADLFRGKNVPPEIFAAGARDVSEREATLTDTQIGDYSGKIVAVLEKQLGAQLRAQ